MNIINIKIKRTEYNYLQYKVEFKSKRAFHFYCDNLNLIFNNNYPSDFIKNYKTSNRTGDFLTSKKEAARLRLLIYKNNRQVKFNNKFNEMIK